MEKRIWKIVFVISVTLSLGFSQDGEYDKFTLSPSVKSLLIPGWGQYSLDEKKHGNVFVSTEVLGFALTAFCIIQSNNAEDTYIALAAKHAGVNSNGKDYQYWIDIGNYNNIDDYNDEHLRWREFDSIYKLNDKWDWHWDSEENRKKFEDQRIKSDNYKLATKFVVGGIVLNHIISAINGHYLKNISIMDNASVQTYIDPQSHSIHYSFSFYLK